ncbi:AN1-type zinc finger protein 4 [Polypterus senegalus]|uniref:AN1-type zinc finger protein 4 n=1 Tax=Polypterus senegalus TaxID=55291 RepID=UPI001963362C|nr:AN1-type zinc finger protein 4 [Polypterus senegalus]
MANKKEPPFFNEDSLGSFYCKLPFYETMELFIETLTGTCFELRVSPFETVVSVKAKIHRLEGIPVAQQHLIWNNAELEDEYCLNDYNISEGCTLKLVLAMRGGPINTRRVPMDDPIKEMVDFMDPNQEDIWEKTTSNKQVTFLVYREGDQLNFFRVVDRGDGTLTPMSESLSGGSVYNLYTEEEEESEASPSGQQIIENSITMNKMKLLKAKMESMNLSKKPKKTAKVKPRPPIGPRASSSPMNTARQRLFRVLPHIGQSLNPASCLPPVGDQNPSVAASSVHSPLSTLTSSGSSTVPSSSCYLLNEEETWKCPVLGSPLTKIRSPPKVSRVELGNSKLLRNSLPPLTSLEDREECDILEETLDSQKYSLQIEDDLVSSTHEDPFAVVSESVADCDPSSTVSIELEHTSKGLGSIEEDAVLHFIPKALSSDSMDTGVLSTDQTSLKAVKVLAGLQYPSQLSTIGKLQRLPKPFEYSASLRPHMAHTMLKSGERSSMPSASPIRTPRYRGVAVDSTGKRPNVLSKTEARDITEIANKASKEPLGSVNNLGLLASLARSSSGNTSQKNFGASGLCATSGVLPNSLHLFQEDLLRKMSPAGDTSSSAMVANGRCSSGGTSGSLRRVGTPTYHLPPVKAPIPAKKKNSKHCFLCGKKTGLATSYECRCGNNFCAVHRYAETHECTYDYKSAGRRYLQETNPVISAPKLPKI